MTSEFPIKELAGLSLAQASLAVLGLSLRETSSLRSVARPTRSGQKGLRRGYPALLPVANSLSCNADIILKPFGP